jgi:hypothetical protein
MSLLNDLIRLSNTNVDISKNTQTHIKFFIKFGRCSLLSNAEHPPCTIIITMPTPVSKMIIVLKNLFTNRLNREHNHNVPKQNPIKPPRITQSFQTLGVKQISSKLSYQHFSQYSNQHIRHQQNPSPNKHQLTNLQTIN